MIVPLLLSTAAALIPLVSSQNLPCRIWGHSTAYGISPSNSDSNSTLWIQGGRRRTSAGQTDNTWTNELLYLDLTSSFDISNAQFQSLDASGAPSLALGGLWSSNDGQLLHQFGGASSDTPVVEPPANALYSYDISTNSWSTSDTGSVSRSAEGARTVISRINEEPLAIFGFGHLDYLTTNTWSIHTPRMLLNSMVTIDLADLSFGNITGGPTARADNTLSFIPYAGSNNEGQLISVGGYTGSSLLSNERLDIYDVNRAVWSTEETEGESPSGRVNHCAAEGRVFRNGAWQQQIFVFGGQNLDQTEQYNDLYVLLLPEYTWEHITSFTGSTPAPRAGHSCNFVGSQLIVIGGFVRDAESCDSTPLSILNVETMEWSTSYDSSATAYKAPRTLEGDIPGSADGTGSSGRNRFEPEDGSSGTPGTPLTTSSTTRVRTSATTRTQIGIQTGVSRTSTVADSEKTSNGPNNGELNTGSTPSKASMVGIIASVLLSTFLLLGLAFFCLRRRNRAKRYAELRDAAGSDVDSIFDVRDDADSINDYSDPFLPLTGANNGSKWPSRTNVPLNRFALDSTSLLSHHSDGDDWNPVVVIPPSPHESNEYTSSSEGGGLRPSLRKRNSGKNDEEDGNSISDRRTVSSFGFGLGDMDVQQGEDGGRLGKRENLQVANPDHR